MAEGNSARLQWAPAGRWAACFYLAAVVNCVAQSALPGTVPLTGNDDLSAAMVAGIGRYLDAATAASVKTRAERWPVKDTSPQDAERSVAANRARLAKILGVVDPRIAAPQMELVGTAGSPGVVAETEAFTVYAVRWPVLDGVHGEGLWLRPRGEPRARVIALPDADQTPETIAGLTAGLPPGQQYARRLAEMGCEVIVPTLIDRTDTFSGNPRVGRATNQPHREWIYRQAYELGRHVIGYEVQKVLAAVDCFTRQDVALPIGAIGWGEGGLLAFYCAALDPRINVTLVSGYIGPREELWREPIYRNVFGLLREFGDAEILRLIQPRTVFIDHTPVPAVNGPPAPRPRFNGAAPGILSTPTEASARAEVERAAQLRPETATRFVFAARDPNDAAAAEETWRKFGRALTGDRSLSSAAGRNPVDARRGFDPVARQQRQVAELEQFTQRLLPLSRSVRDDFLWKKVPISTPAGWRDAMQPYREKFWNDVIGRLPAAAVPPSPRSRQIAEHETWTAHEVVLEVRPDIFAWGYLLLPRGIKPGEKRPVVVVQHGLEGVPADTINEDPQSRAFAYYKAFGVRLVERGFIVFAPHNPYRGEDRFRTLQRKANPLGLSLFSFIIAQHEVILDWLATLPNVDAARMGFYGLSYGGKTAMRVPAVLERYALSICSGDFNEWIWKNATTEWAGSYLFTKEWEMPEFDLGSTFGYAEMAALIAPRPFMVERGHDDGVGLDEWVAFEYAKVKRLYDRLNVPERTAIEYFVGPHTIHGEGTFKFLHEQLRWPER